MRVSRVDGDTLFGTTASTVTRIANRTGLNAGAILGASRRTGRHADASRDYFAVMMDLDVSDVAGYLARDARKSVYIFDAWPAKHRQIIELVRAWGIQYAFVSSSQAAERLAAAADRGTFIWVPEGIDVARYRYRLPLERDIDVLQLGRKFDDHHRVIVPALANAGKSYVFEKEKGKVIFPTREEFVNGLARSRISICVPSSVTHPERAGDIETMTVRYLQSMASRCLVLGHAPSEMIDLFGYNPVVEIDMSDPAGQILELLAWYESYLGLIDKNYSVVAGHHTWDSRWSRMSEVLFPS